HADAGRIAENTTRGVPLMMRQTSVLAVVLALLSVAPGAQSRRFITERDLLSFTWVADPQISPDGTAVAFVQVTVNEKENRYESSIYLVPSKGGETHRLTSGIRDTSPRWSPDGRQIAFVRVSPAAADGRPAVSQIYVLAMAGGEAHAI